MFRLQSEAQVTSHATAVEDRPPGLVRPEVHHRLKVGIPIVDVRGEDRAQQGILTGAVIEPGQQPFQDGPAAKPIKQ